MCSVMGYLGSIDRESFVSAFGSTVARGPDDTKIVDTGHGLLGFHRLSVMGLTPEGMQPFSLDDDFLVCNGEIYGFEAMRRALEKKGYRFRSNSDCEILLPLYREYGTGMFGMLDAEFAMILYDGRKKEFLAARDPIGIRPLYYGYGADGSIAFASEPSSLLPLCKKVLPFPPGHYFEDGAFHCYEDISKVTHVLTDDLETVTRNIREKLTRGIEKRLVSDAKVGYLLSGGLDSSLVSAIAAKKSRVPIRTFAIGMKKDAIDLKYARDVADFIGSEHTEVYMTPDDVIGSLETVIRILGTYDITTIRASMGMYLLCKSIHETSDIRVLLTGEISDELFGYKYTDFAPSAGEFQKESEKRIREIHAYDVLRADRCISENSLEARVPFGDLDFVRYVMAISPALKMNTYGKGKYLLRHAFEKEGLLPSHILWREKAAFSDAVGHSMVDDLKAYAETCYTDEEFEAGCRKYSYAAPYTKESLLYRDIFETYYPGQAEMIPGFWLPNPKWKGCAVTDPSARVLSNYGDSGK